MMKEINVFTFIIFDLLTHGTETKLTAQDWGGGGGGERNKREMQAFSSRGTRRQLIIFFFIFM